MYFVIKSGVSCLPVIAVLSSEYSSDCTCLSKSNGVTFIVVVGQHIGRQQPHTRLGAESACGALRMQFLNSSSLPDHMYLKTYLLGHACAWASMQLAQLPLTGHLCVRS
jgi:hypothetical protein